MNPFPKTIHLRFVEKGNFARPRYTILTAETQSKVGGVIPYNGRYCFISYESSVFLTQVEIKELSRVIAYLNREFGTQGESPNDNI